MVSNLEKTMQQRIKVLPAIAGALLANTVANATVTELTLNYNFNGILHELEFADPDNLDGYRSISDRGIDVGLSVPAALTVSGRPGSSLTYTIVRTDYTLDIVHLGNRNTVDNGNWAYDDADGADGDNIGVSPNWQPIGTSDQTGPQTSTFTPIPLNANAEIGVIYQSSNGGGMFDMTLGFTDGTSVTVRLDAPDWFLAASPEPAATGVAYQATMGTFPAVDQVDQANFNAPELNVVEAHVSGSSLLTGLGFDLTNKSLDSITFSNQSNPIAGYAILAASVDDNPATGACCQSDGSCEEITSLGCADAGGTYQGDATTCASAECPDLRLGACCDGDICTIATVDDCDTAGGAFQGPDTDCGDGGNPMLESEDDTVEFPADIMSDTLTVDSADTITSIEVNVNLDSTWVGDVYMTLDGPGGSIVLLNRAGQAGGQPLDGTNVCCGDNADLAGDYTLTDAAIETIPDQAAFLTGATDVIPPGPYLPSDADNVITSLNGTFAGTAAGGDWTLNVFDGAPGDDLLFNSWSLTINGQPATLAGNPCGACECEVNGTDPVDISDLLAFLGDWFDGNIASDIDGNGVGGEITDLLGFLGCWFPASTTGVCP